MSRNWRLPIAALLTIMLSMVGVGPALAAGDGTAANPWRSIWSVATYPYSGHVTAVYQHITPLYDLPDGLMQFWSFNFNFQYSKQGFYAGIQRNGWLYDTSTTPRTHYVYPTVAKFGLFAGPNSSTFLMLDPSHCFIGADIGNGITCQIPLYWTTGTEYRITVNVYENITANGWCPPASPHLCTVYQAVLASASDLSYQTPISVWSVAPSSFGIVTDSNSFLEYWGQTHTAGCTKHYAVEGRFVIPYKQNGSALYPANHVGSSDHFTDTGLPLCDWEWNAGLATYITL
jgi:hypothetical protein